MTGTGKTLVYLLPILEKLFNDPHGIFALIISPTRELAIHIHQQFLFFGSKMNLKATLLIGGENYVTQSVELDQIPHVLVATPGKLFDMFQNNPIVSKYIKNLKFLVLDEFDRLLEPSLLHFLNPVFAKLPISKQVILTTATFDERLTQLDSLKKSFGFSDELNIKSFNLNREVKVVEAIQHFYVFMPRLIKDYYFIYLMQEEYNNLGESFDQSIIIFFKRCK